jgi:uncharacterized membrane protein AbrB (regulator of aidB expression)
LNPGDAWLSHGREDLRALGRNGRIVAVAFAGGALCAGLGVPAAWLTGGMIASAAAVSGLGWRGPSPRMVDAAMLLCGLLLGSAATPEAIAAAARYPASLAVMMLAVAGIVVATGGYLSLVARWPKLDALLAAAPGALSAVMAVGYACKREMSRIDRKSTRLNSSHRLTSRMPSSA